MFPINRPLCGAAPQNQHRAPRIDCLFFILLINIIIIYFFITRFGNLKIVPSIHLRIAPVLPVILVHTHIHTRSESDDTLTHEPTDVTRRLATGHAGVDKLPDYFNYYGVIITKT